MKKLHNILLLALSCAMSSCVEPEYENLYLKDEFGNTIPEATTQVLGAYASLVQYDYYRYSMLHALANYEDTIFRVDNGQNAVSAFDMHSSATITYANPWGEIYSGVNICNEILKHVPSIEPTSEAEVIEKERILAEAHFLRALFYYDLVRCYSSDDTKANFPYRIEPFDELQDMYTYVKSANDIYELIIYPDLEYATGMIDTESYRLPYYADSKSEIGRATLGSAQALAASVYLTRKEYQKAIDFSEMVTNNSKHGYSLLSDYADLWDIDNETNAYNEVVFGVPFISNASYLDLGSCYAYIYGPNGVNIDGSPLSGNASGKGGNDALFQNWFVRFYQEDTKYGYCSQVDDAGEAIDGSDIYLKYRDTRIEDSFFREYCVGSYGEVTGTNMFYPAAESNAAVALRKYIDPKGVANNSNGNDYYMFRLAEMYLIQAEAYNELNDQAKSYKAFNVVRQRARVSSGREWPQDIDAGGRSFSKDEFRWVVFMERGLELSGEMKRWYDLIRMEYQGQSMYDYMMNTYIPSLAAKYVNTQKGVMSARKKYFPIPATEISRNQLVKQNPQY